MWSVYQNTKGFHIGPFVLTSLKLQQIKWFILSISTCLKLGALVWKNKNFEELQHCCVVQKKTLGPLVLSPLNPGEHRAVLFRNQSSEFRTLGLIF